MLQRLRKKALTYAQDFAPDGAILDNGTGKIDVDGVVDLYESFIIPLTKDIEVCLFVVCLGYWCSRVVGGLSLVQAGWLVEGRD